MTRFNGYNVAVSLAVASGSFAYGYSIAILGNTLGKKQFFIDMKVVPGTDYATSIIALWNCILYVGGLLTCACVPWVADRFGRKRVLMVGSSLAIIGSALQAGSINPSMLVVARLIIGFGIGFLMPGVPLYQAEIAPPSSRGLIVGLHGALLGCGLSVASWIGVAFFHVPGAAGWRAPLAIQTAFPLLLFTLLFFLPESPRWLYMHGQAEEARRTLQMLHASKGDDQDGFANKEFQIIKAQIDYELAHRESFLQGMKRASIRKRFFLGWLVITGTQVSALLVVLTYQATIYENLGFTPFQSGILAAAWTVCCGAGNLLGGILGDYVGRKRQIFWGLISLVIVLIILCITTELYAAGVNGVTNHAGNSAAAAFTFLLIVCYSVGVESSSFVYASELYPGPWRAAGLSSSTTAIFFWGTIFTAVASPAFKNIGALYYVVFIVLSFVMVLVTALVYPNTKGFSLEQVAALFGDNVVGMNGQLQAGAEFVKDDHDINHVEFSETDTEQVIDMTEGKH